MPSSQCRTAKGRGMAGKDRPNGDLEGACTGQSPCCSTEPDWGRASDLSGHGGEQRAVMVHQLASSIAIPFQTSCRYHDLQTGRVFLSILTSERG
jgi:hypothetical protein